MSTVTVRYFAVLRERLGLEREAVAVPASGTTLAELLAALAAVHGEAAVEALTGPGVRIAVDDELVEADPGRLAPGATIAFLPPVTGG